MNLAEVREKYPQYKDVPDDKLADGLYNKYYANKLSRDEFNKKIGYVPQDENANPFVSRLQSGAKDLAAQVPKFVPNVLTGIAQGTYDLGSLVPGFNKVVPAPQSVNEIVGLGPQTSGDKGVSKFASFLPTLLASEVALPAKLFQGASTVPYLFGQAAKQGAEGALYAGSQGENPLVGGAVGAAFPLGQFGFNKGAEVFEELIKNPVKKAILQNVGPKVLEREFAMNIAPEDAMIQFEHQIRHNFNKNLNNYLDYEDAAVKSASNLDLFSKKSFNPKTYDEKLNVLKNVKSELADSGYANEDLIQVINELSKRGANSKTSKPFTKDQLNFLKSVQGQAGKGSSNTLDEILSTKNIKSSSKKNDLLFDDSHYTNSLNSLRKKLNPVRDAAEIADIDALLQSSPKTFKDAVEQRKYINRELPLNSVSKTARSSLIKSVEDNAHNLGTDNAIDFLKLWSEANRKYKDEVVPFFKLPDLQGNLVPNQRLKQSLYNQGDAEGNLINNYIPKGQRVDTLGAKQLAQLLGDEEAAANALRAGYFKKDYFSTAEGEIPRNTLLTKYHQLSPAQRAAMFKPKEIELLDSLLANKNQFLLDNGTIKGGSKDVLKGAAIGGLAGETIGHLLGMPLGGAGAYLGAIGGKNIFDILTNRYATGEKYLKLSKELQAAEKSKKRS